jgi:alpha-tubulin suppressor-like RCC1 family protein
MSDGGVVCWGSNDYGQLGVDPDTLSATTTPTNVTGLGAGEDWQAGRRMLIQGCAKACACQ